MMMERGDFATLHEPFSHVVDFGHATVDGREVADEAGVIDQIRRRAARRSVFFKDTTDFRYPGLLADRSFLSEVTHGFIVRDPAEVIASHYALNAELTCDEVGFERLSEIFDAVVEATGATPVVLNSTDLIAEPDELVRAYCAAIGIRFIPDAMAWQAQMRPEWRKTRRWHELTSRTTGFAAERSHYDHTVHNNATLGRFYAHHLPYYEKLNRYRLPLPSRS